MTQGASTLQTQDNIHVPPFTEAFKERTISKHVTAETFLAEFHNESDTDPNLSLFAKYSFSNISQTWVGSCFYFDSQGNFHYISFNESIEDKREKESQYISILRKIDRSRTDFIEAEFFVDDKTDEISIFFCGKERKNEMDWNLMVQKELLLNPNKADYKITIINENQNFTQVQMSIGNKHYIVNLPYPSDILIRQFRSEFDGIEVVNLVPEAPKQALTIIERLRAHNH